MQQNTLKMRVEQAKSKWELVNRSFESMSNENKEIENQMVTIDSSKGSINQELQSSQEREETLKNEITSAQKDLEKLRLDEVAKLASSEEARLLLNEVLQKCGFSKQNITRIDEELKALEEELELLEQYKGNTSQGVKEKQDEIQKNLTQIEIAKELVVEIEAQVKEETGKKEALIVQNKDLLDKREEKANLMRDLDKENYRLSGQKEAKETEETQLTNYMWDEYEITLSDAATLRDESMTDLTMMKREVSSLREQIKGLGPVNVNAIEDYKNVVERYEFLKSQHDDLIEAEAVLIRIVEELDASMRKQFNEKFHEIAKEFDHVFKELFGGGKGTLELMEDEDVLEAGVKIIAQPPGKKLQNMMQLSGGEKALAAIALLFAIQNLKPSPFCLLDEIEAALDESNVERFAKYLGKLTKHTQFIVITHRRGTMEKADRLYGITMQEKGVSALVSVNLIEKELEEQG